MAVDLVWSKAAPEGQVSAWVTCSRVDRPRIQHILCFSLSGHCSIMPQHRLWMALAPLLAALTTGESMTSSVKAGQRGACCVLGG